MAFVGDRGMHWCWLWRLLLGSVFITSVFMTSPARGATPRSGVDNGETIDLSDIPQSLKFFGPAGDVPDPGVEIHSRVAELSRRAGDGKSIELVPISESQLIPLGNLSPLKLEATSEQLISMRQALEMALDNNLPIKASKADYDSSRYKYLGTFGNFLPSVLNSLIPLRTQGAGLNVRTNPYYVLLSYPVFQGGSVLFDNLKNRNQMRASRYALSAEINNVLLAVFDQYMDVLLHRALLEVRAIAVEVAKEQHRTNRYMKAAGLGTQFDVMQSATLLADEKQKLIRAESDLRRAALKLAVSLNVPLITNLIPTEGEITSDALVDPKLSAQLLTSVAMENRPEIVRLENLRQAARKQIALAAAPLLPQVAFFQAAAINTEVKGRGAGGQSALVVPVGAGFISLGAGANNSFSSGFGLNWGLNGLGIENSADVLAAKAQARKALIEFNQLVLNINEEVRAAYIDSLAARSEIDVANDAVRAGAEEMRLADWRLKYQLGTNLELTQAEKDFIEALSRRVETIVRYRKSQGRLLYAIGKISVASLTNPQPLSFDSRR